MQIIIMAKFPGDRLRLQAALAGLIEFTNGDYGYDEEEEDYWLTSFVLFVCSMFDHEVYVFHINDTATAFIFPAFSF